MPSPIRAANPRAPICPTPTRLARHPFLVLSVLALLLSQACFSARPWRMRDRPWDAVVLEKAQQVRVHMFDGTILVLVDVTLEQGAGGTFLRGTVVDDEGQRLGAVVLPALEVQQLETRKLEAARLTAKIGIWVGVVVVGVYLVLVITLACIFYVDCNFPAPLGIVDALPASGPRSLLRGRLAVAPRWA